jgi:hypothetical protein
VVRSWLCLPRLFRHGQKPIDDRRGVSQAFEKACCPHFKDQSEYTGLSHKSKRAYDHYLKLIDAEFGSMPIGALEDRRARGDFKAFRNTFASTPRKADYVWTTIARVLSVAKHHGKISVNVCERGGRLYESDRRQCGAQRIFARSATSHLSN